MWTGQVQSLCFRGAGYFFLFEYLQSAWWRRYCVTIHQIVAHASNTRPSDSSKLLILRGNNGGEGGIRTPGRSFPLRRFSKPLLSTTQPPLREMHMVLKGILPYRRAGIEKGEGAIAHRSEAQ